MDKPSRKFSITKAAIQKQSKRIWIDWRAQTRNEIFGLFDAIIVETGECMAFAKRCTTEQLAGVERLTGN